MNETIVIYHGGCRDGFCAAWVHWKYLKSTYDGTESFGWPPVIYHPGYYGQEPPNVKDKNVIILDFCYPLDVMMDIIEQCKSLHIIDHHKTAAPVIKSISNAIENNEIIIHNKGINSITMTFDLEKSGAGLAWDYFFPSQPRPWLVDYVEDRDLWAKKLPGTDEVNGLIACLEFSFEEWNKWEAHPLTSIQQAGRVALMKTEQYVREVCKNVYFVDIVNSGDIQFNHSIGGHTRGEKLFSNIPTVNICQIDCSEVLHELSKLYPNSPFSLYWFKRHDGMYQYGLRSIGDFDVSTVAKLFGGGGHKNAAGFQLNYLLEELK